MISFLLCLALLIGGYLVYGKVVENTFGPDDRETPAVKINDGVDYVVLPEWKLFMIQLLNIAGLGPIFGALQGALWGPIVFLWITFGTIFAGAVHDYFSGMMSERNEGASISEIAGIYLGGAMKNVMRVFSVVLLVMVGTVFAVGPAGLIVTLFKQGGHTGIVATTLFWLIIVLIYYFIATFLSIDKIIGKIYPLFGICLIVMAVGVAIGIFVNPAYTIPEIWSHFGSMHPSGTPIWSFMFITVACGAISGFHATQSPLMARCMKSEKQGHFVFYGAMVSEGIIALIWAAAGCSLYEVTGGLNTGLAAALANGQSAAIYDVCLKTMGGIGTALAMLGVIACPITSGDTAFRSARLVLADWLKLDQKSMKNRPRAGRRRLPRHRQCPRQDRLHHHLALFQLDQSDPRYDRSVGCLHVPLLRKEELLDHRRPRYLHERGLRHLFPAGQRVPRQADQHQDRGGCYRLQHGGRLSHRYPGRGSVPRYLPVHHQEAPHPAALRDPAQVNPIPQSGESVPPAALLTLEERL